MIIPVGERYQQTLYLFQKKEGKLVPEALHPTIFVPMTGTAEDERQVKPDPLHPSIVNGGFEEVGKAEVAGEKPEDANPDEEIKVPRGWHYMRQGELTYGAPEGKFCLTFSNTEPGRGARACRRFPSTAAKSSSWKSRAGCGPRMSSRANRPINCR